VPFAIDFTFADLAGQTRRLSAVQGQPVLVNLWATWCYPCRSELPSMQALYAAYRERGLVILAIASDAGGRDTVAPFAQAYGLTFPILLDPQNSLGSRLKTPGIPTSYILDKQGRIVTLEVGARDWNKASVRHLLDTLLAEPVVTGYAAEGS
jgi:thiol-disulfide isomerase/thioredoxin